MCFLIRAAASYFRRGWRLEDVLRELQPGSVARNHLVQVYAILARAFLMAAGGSFLAHKGFMDSSPAYFGVLVSIPCFYLTSEQNMALRRYLLMLASWCGGASATHWFTISKGVPLSVVMASLLGYALYLCFHCATCQWDRSPLMQIWCVNGHSYGFTGVMAAYLAGEFFLDFGFFQWCHELSLPILASVSYILAYNYEISLSARNGDGDYLNHAMKFFTHSPAIMLNIIVTTMIEAYEWLVARV